MNRKERILFALRNIGVKELSDFGESHGSAIYSQLYRQLFTDKYNPTVELCEYICKKYPQISARFLLTGEGAWESNKIVTPPQHRQDIHLDAGATAAISQSGTATVAPQVEQTKEPDIAQMIRDNDLGGLVAIIMKQKDEILRLTNQRLEDLERYARIADSQLFPPVK